VSLDFCLNASPNFPNQADESVEYFIPAKWSLRPFIDPLLRLA